MRLRTSAAKRSKQVDNATGRTGNGRFALTVISATGDTLVARQYPPSGTPISAKEADDVVASVIRDLRVPSPHGGRSAFTPPFVERIARKLGVAVPAVKLKLERVVVGLDNSIWLELARRPDGRLYLIFDVKGNPLGEGVFNKSNGFILRAAMRNVVWLMDIDDDGVPSIVRYRVEPMRQRCTTLRSGPYAMNASAGQPVRR